MILTTAMSALLTTCAPRVGQQTMAGIVEYESGWKPWAIGDNTARKSYFLASKDQAVRVAVILLAEGHNLDVGLAQVNSDNFSSYGLNALTAFDPCTNVHVGSQILTNAYSGAMRRDWIGRPIKTQTDLYYQQQYALIHALSAYNSGRYWASMGYAHDVYSLARNVRIEFSAVPISPIYQRVATYAPQVHAPAGRAVPFRPSWGQRDAHLNAIQVLHSSSKSTSGDQP